VPVWHAKTNALRTAGKLQVVGIVQEQHPSRAQLFMQFKQMNWPVMVDSLDLLGLKVVPVAVAIDEHGIVRHVNPKPDTLAREFVAKTYAKGPVPPPAGKPDLDALRSKARANPSPNNLRALGDATFLWGGRQYTGDAIAAYRRALRGDDDPALMFRLGVASRRRFDALGESRDFAFAVGHWQRAIDRDPNQYIWRRRIQQYGPRSTKPYPFYDWVAGARKAIIARGEKPISLEVEPRGAELAKPLGSQETARTPPAAKDPDPKRKVRRDEGYVATSIVIVPPHIKAGQTARVHVRFQPRAVKTAHWNNEAEDLALWISPPAGWTVDRKLSTHPRPKSETSDELRKVEIEVTAPATAKPGVTPVAAHAVYYVCEDKDGSCLYRRTDLRIPIRVVP